MNCNQHIEIKEEQPMRFRELMIFATRNFSYLSHDTTEWSVQQYNTLSQQIRIRLSSGEIIKWKNGWKE